MIPSHGLEVREKNAVKCALQHRWISPPNFQFDMKLHSPVAGVLTSVVYHQHQSTAAHLEIRQLGPNTRRRKQGSCPCQKQTIVPQ